MFKAIKILLGGALLAFGLVFWLRYSLPSLLRDAWYANDFEPAYELKITQAKCTTWNGFLFHMCDVTYSSDDATITGTLHHQGFGRAPSGSVSLLRAVSNPAVITTDISLASLGSRAAFAAVILLFICACAFGAGKRVARKLYP